MAVLHCGGWASSATHPLPRRPTSLPLTRIPPGWPAVVIASIRCWFWSAAIPVYRWLQGDGTMQPGRPRPRTADLRRDHPGGAGVSHPAAYGTLVGMAAAPGTAAGRARVILDPVGANVEPGEILVARPPTLVGHIVHDGRPPGHRDADGARADGRQGIRHPRRHLRSGRNPVGFQNSVTAADLRFQAARFVLVDQPSQHQSASDSPVVEVRGGIMRAGRGSARCGRRPF